MAHKICRNCYPKTSTFEPGRKNNPICKTTVIFSPPKTDPVNKSLYIKGLQTRYADGYYNIYWEEDIEKRIKNWKREKRSFISVKWTAYSGSAHARWTRKGKNDFWTRTVSLMMRRGSPWTSSAKPAKKQISLPDKKNRLTRLID